MKVKDGFLLREVAGKNIIVAVDDEAADFDGIISVNEVGAFIWKLLSKETTREEITAAILCEYDVSEAAAAADVDAFIAKAESHGFLE